MNSVPPADSAPPDLPLRVDSPLDVSTAATWHRRVSDFLAARTEARIDLGGVGHVDLFGLQLLIAARRTADATGRTLAWLNVPACIHETSTRAGLADNLFEPSRT